jgi:hypothetical protein
MYRTTTALFIVACSFASPGCLVQPADESEVFSETSSALTLECPADLDAGDVPPPCARLLRQTFLGPVQRGGSEETAKPEPVPWAQTHTTR